MSDRPLALLSLEPHYPKYHIMCVRLIPEHPAATRRGDGARWMV